MEYNDLGVDEATVWLYQFAGEQDDEKFLDEFERDLQDIEERTAVLPYFNERVLDKWRFETWGCDGRAEKAEEYLWKKWRILPSTADRFKIGYDPNHRRMNPKEGESYEGPALIFPHFWKGRLVGWQERWLGDDEERPKWVPKYTNTTDMPRQNTIFNYESALTAQEPVFVVESLPTVYCLESHDYPATGTFGSSVRPEQLRLLRRFSQGVILCPDADVSSAGVTAKPSKAQQKTPAGLKWRKTLTDYLERFIPVYWLPPVPLAPGSDLADLAVEYGSEALHEYIEDLVTDPIIGDL
jgi:hypothetical protein